MTSRSRCHKRAANLEMMSPLLAQATWNALRTESGRLDSGDMRPNLQGKNSHTDKYTHIKYPYLQNDYSYGIGNRRDTLRIEFPSFHGRWPFARRLFGQDNRYSSRGTLSFVHRLLHVRRATDRSTSLSAEVPSEILEK